MRPARLLVTKSLPSCCSARSRWPLRWPAFWARGILYIKRTDLPAKLVKRAGGLYTLVYEKYRVDEFYGAAIIQPIILFSTYVLYKGIDVALIDGGVDASAEGAKEISDGLRHMQSGNIRSYAGWVAAGAAAVIAFMVWRGVR